MPFNGAGVFQRVRNWMADAAAGIKIRADYHDSEDDGFATGLSNCITRDGQTIITQNIPWNSKRITGLEDPVNDQDAVTKKYTATQLTTLPDPVNPGDATNKAYVDARDQSLIQGIDAANANANNRVLRSGDTMTGALSVPSLTSGPITSGPVYSTGTSRFVDKCFVEGAGQPLFAVHNTTAHQAWGFWVDAGPMFFGYTDAAGTPQAVMMTLNAGGDLGITRQGYKPGGGSWAASSDARIKNVLGDYSSSLDEIAELQPVRYTYKGNDTLVSGGTSPHQQVAGAGTEFIGLIAQEAEAVMPELVGYTEGYIDGSAVSDLRTLDTTPLIFALINAVKELKARVEALEAQ